MNENSNIYIHKINHKSMELGAWNLRADDTQVYFIILLNYNYAMNQQYEMFPSKQNH